MLLLKLFVAIALVLFHTVEAKGPHQHIKYYEELKYDRLQLLEQHERVKRSTQSSNGGLGHVMLRFQSHGGHFNIRLVQDKTVFHADLELVDGEGIPIDSDVSHIYHGTIYGKKNSLVHGNIIDGVFTGVVKDPDRGTYYIEEANAFFEGKPPLVRQNGHSVIYHEKDVDYPHRYGPHKTCGSSFSDVEKYMQKVQKSAVFSGDEKQHLRKKRAVSSEKNTCLLYIRTDHMLWKKMQSREKIIGKISEHVKELNTMYNPTEFSSSSGTMRNIGFMVKRMMINETTDPNDLFYSPNIGVEKFLELASSQNHNDYCLAYVFTHRDFDNGVLGLAWVGGVGSTGGICDKYRQYDGKAGKSLNTGIVTFENYGSTVPSRVSHITFAHEVGHNFGSPHDSGSQCTPGESFRSVGNYIMFASATSGQKDNNRKFSDCSKGNMSRVLEAKKDDCFVESDLPICGNAILDEGEECDCGYADQCEEVFDQNCCYPADDKKNGCKLKSKAKCSITQGPCCDPSTCNFRSSSYVCSPDAECQKEQTCSSDSYSCPTAEPKGNGTVECNYGTQVCWAGECSRSICEKYGLEECSCKVPENGDTSIACHACCQTKSMPDTCKSTGDSEYSPFFNGTTIHLQPGSPCDNFKGYCDMFSKCRQVDADGPLSRLKKAILNPELYRTIKEWIVQYWWAVVLMCLALVMLMAGFIKLCSVHTPSNNPRLPKHRQLPGAGTLKRRRQAQQRRQQNQRSRMNYEMRIH
uniref:disintegrin and metalloproteinase domain-containing protein 10-like n=1 Tax=Styela clava TaxID=7725 RepID=UPI00193ABA1E|nr:disintegrin and metalloproteinase domain-containing protein 10-like [Styela clava]